MMERAVVIEAPGGPEQMRLVEVDVGEPGPGEIRIRHHACGLNYIDVYHRNGAYPLPLPARLGMEGAGVVEAVGEGVTHLRAGDRAAYTSQPPGAYSTARVMPAKAVLKLPDAIDYETAAGMMLKGLTAQYLLKRTQPQGGLKAGDFVLFHAAAGGVGSLLCQWASRLGAEVTILEALPKPENLTAKDAPGGVGLEWKTSRPAAEFRVFRRPKSEKEWTKAMEEPDFAQRFTAAMDCRGIYLGRAVAAAL